MNKDFKCFITDLETFPPNNSLSGGIIQYVIKPFPKKEINLIFSSNANDWTDDESVLYGGGKDTTYYIEEKIKNIKHILCGIIYNNKWPKGFLMLNKFTIDNIIKNADYPQTPKEKLDYLLVNLFKNRNFDGEGLMIGPDIKKDKSIINKFYFINQQEFIFYIKTLRVKELITIDNYGDSDGHLPDYIDITYKGLEELLKIESEGKLSNNCFVAMSFDKTEDEIYFKAIKPACEETGFIAKRIDYENYDSEKTINDAIIALLKQCKFCIADFTKQRDGVYFESGYALGRGMKVIYTCNEADFKKSHFDTNHFPHIVYKNLEELKQKLIDKINAKIKD